MKNEEEFKVGDWVIKKDNIFSEGSWEGAFQIAKLTPVGGNSKEQYCYNSKGHNNYLSNFRKALSYEIPNHPQHYEYLIPLLEKLNIK